MAFRSSPVKLDGEGLWTYALRVLARRPHSVGELRQKLLRRAADRTIAIATMEKLSEYGLVNDKHFSEAFASARLQNQGFGKQRVLRDLRTKQVVGKTAEDAIQKVFEDTDESTLIHQFLERKYRGKSLPVFLQEEKNLLGVYRRLRLAGFSSSLSLATLRQYKSDLPELEEHEETED